MTIESPVAPQVALPTLSALELLVVILALAARFEALAAQHAEGDDAPDTRKKNTPKHAAPRFVVPITVSGCMTRLQAACVTLSQAAHADATELAQKKTAKSDNRHRYKRAWSAVRAMFGAWREADAFTKLPVSSRDAFERVFPEGAVPPLRGSSRAVWSASAAVLTRAKREGVDGVVRALGGADVYGHLLREHDALGVALGLDTAHAPAPDAIMLGVTEVVPLAEALAAAKDILREYVLKVTAMAGPEVPGSTELVAQLLKPLYDAALERATRTRRTKTKAPAEHDVPTRPVAPANDGSVVARPTGTG